MFVIRESDELFLFDVEPVVLNLLNTFWGLQGLPFFRPHDLHVLRNGMCHYEKPCDDILKTDYHMSGMSAYERLERQREKRHMQQLLVLTSILLDSPRFYLLLLPMGRVAHAEQKPGNTIALREQNNQKTASNYF